MIFDNKTLHLQKQTGKMEHKLLPHKFQTPAFITFVVSFILVLISAIIDTQSALFQGETTRTIFQIFVIVLMYASLLVTIFSAEKLEDEMMTSMRLNSAALAFTIGFGLIAVLNIIQVLLPDAAYEALKAWRVRSFWNGNAIIYLVIIYYLAFKIKVWNLEKRMKDEE